MAYLLEWKARDGLTHRRLLDRINGRLVTVIRDLGTMEPFAEDMKTYYRKAKAMGFVFNPPITAADIQGFLKAKAEGREYGNDGKRLTIEEFVDLWLEKYGPSLKEGVNDIYGSPYYNLKMRLGKVKREWASRWTDTITLYDVRDLLATRKQPGTKMRLIGSMGAMFKGAARWNVLGNVLPYKIRLPPYNPFKEWRAEMPAAQKLELPDERVLEPDEWDKFKVCLSSRSRAICEIALRRFLRLADIKKLSHLSKRDKYLRGLQEKTGDPFLVPLIQEGPIKYDFTNFLGDFQKAQVAAGMNWPADHKLHFSPKDLRRTGATWAWRARPEDLLKISAMLGHKLLSTTQRYLRIRREDVQSVADAVDAIANRNRKTKAS